MVERFIFFIKKYTMGLFCLPSRLNFTCGFIGLLDVADFLQAVSGVAFVSHWLFLSLFYCFALFDCLSL